MAKLYIDNAPKKSLKQPFLPETRNAGNVCVCAACGTQGRATVKPPTGFYGPERWETRTLVDDSYEKFLVYQCEHCVRSGNIDGDAARRFFDTHNMIWISGQKIWEPIQIEAPPTAKKEEKTAMTTSAIEKVTLKEKAAGQAHALGGAVALGAKLATVDEIGELLVDIAKEMGKDNPLLAAALSDETGRESVKAAMAVLIHSLCTYSDMVPQGALVKRAAELQVTASAETLLKPRMRDLRKMFGQLALIGEKVAEMEGGNASGREEVEEEAPASKAAARASR